jgi:hypothetical protein
MNWTGISRLMITNGMLTMQTQKPTSPLLLMLFWFYVTIPLLWGVASTIRKALALFG